MKEQPQKEPVVTLGEHFRKERELRGIELDEVSKVTRVRMAYLQRLEEDRFAELPPDVYSCGYIRAYARFLGVDADQCIALYRKQAPEQGLSPAAAFSASFGSGLGGHSDRPLPKLNEEPSEPVATPTSTGGMAAGAMGGRGGGGRSRVGLALVIVMLLCAALLIAGVYYVNRSGDPGPDSANRPPAAKNEKNTEFFLDS